MIGNHLMKIIILLWKTLLPQLIGKGHRILIFSQWTRCLDLLGCLMDALCISCLRLDGQTTINERQTLIDQFTHDTSIPVFLLSTRAGGMGMYFPCFNRMEMNK